MMVYEPWMDYVISDEDGWCGVRDDAPEWAKAAWEKFRLGEQAAYTADGVKILT